MSIASTQKMPVNLGAEVLVVDDEPHVREIMTRFLTSVGCKVRQAQDVPTARVAISEKLPNLVFLDINMPGPSGLELLEELAPQWPTVAVIMSTAVGDIQVATEAIRAGAADYLQKPVNLQTLKLVAGRTLERRNLLIENKRYQEQLETLVQERTEELRQKTAQLLRTQAALVYGLCRLTEFRDPDTGEHLGRMARYAQILAAHVQKKHPELPGDFDELVYEAAPLHDIGKVGIPDAILLKPGRLNGDEFELMKRHTLIGAETLSIVKKRLHMNYAAFIDIGSEICLGHHERWDGKGYPYGRKAGDIAISARIAAVADYFDACTSPRVYRPRPIPYEEVRAAILHNSGRAFDPEIVEAFLAEENQIILTQTSNIPPPTPIRMFQE